MGFYGVQSSVLNQTSIPTNTRRLLLTSSEVQRNFAWLAGAPRIASRPTFRGRAVLKRNHASQPDHPAVHTVASSSMRLWITRSKNTVPKVSIIHSKKWVTETFESVLHATFSVEIRQKILFSKILFSRESFLFFVIYFSCLNFSRYTRNDYFNLGGKIWLQLHITSLSFCEKLLCSIYTGWN